MMENHTRCLAVILGLGALLVGPVAAQSLTRGDLVLVRDDQNRLAAAAIIAVPGETVQISQGRISINGASMADLPGVEAWGPRRLDTGMYFVAGDQLKVNSDPRFWGVVPITRIVGRWQPLQ
jgi:signal peptidase I